MKDNKLPQAKASGTAQAQKFVSRYNPRDKSRGIIAQNKIIVLGLIGLLVLVVVFLAFSRRPGTVMAPTSQTPSVSTETTPSSQATQSGSTTVHEVSIKAFSFGFDPKTFTVKKGEKVRLRVTNTAGVHNFNIDELGVLASTPAGKEAVIEFTPETSGSFTYYCSIDGHRELGMMGTIVVE